MANVPRGVANNNPLNIRLGAPWEGLRAQQTDPDFCQFISPDWSYRAGEIILMRYYDGRKNEEGSWRETPVRTVRGIISRWAPPSENKTEIYIADVCANTGFSSDEELAVKMYEFAWKLLRAMTIKEVGGFERFGYTKEMIDEGLRKAGIVDVPPAPVFIDQHPQFKRAQNALKVVVGSTSVASIAEAGQQLLGLGQFCKVFLIAGVMLAAGAAVFGMFKPKT